MVPGRQISRIVGPARGPISGLATIARSGISDAVELLDPRRGNGRWPAPDPFALRDPEYIHRTLPAVHAVAERYFRAEVSGLEHIPAEGPVLLVGNHSGGFLIVDTFILGGAFYEHFGVEREFFQLAHDIVFKVPAARAMMAPYGVVPASPGNMRRAIERDAALLVYPGGDRETFRPTWRQSEIDFGGRTGFIRLALELGIPIVPVVSIGGQETALFLGSGERAARLLRLDRWLRLDVAPVQIAPPWGITVLDLPGRIPLPSKISIEVLPPVDLTSAVPDGDVRAGYDFITGLMQTSLDRLTEQRRFPVIG